MISKNKRGMEKIVSIYWFAILIIVAGGIIYMVSIFYGDPYDVRAIESGILTDNIAECLSENGKLKYPLDDSLKGNFASLCHLNLKTNEERQEYYLEISFYDFKTNQKLPLEIGEGNINLKKSNALSRYVFFNSESFYAIDSEGKGIITKVDISINKDEENVK